MVWIIAKLSKSGENIRQHFNAKEIANIQSNISGSRLYYNSFCIGASEKANLNFKSASIQILLDWKLNLEIVCYQYNSSSLILFCSIGINSCVTGKDWAFGWNVTRILQDNYACTWADQQ